MGRDLELVMGEAPRNWWAGAFAAGHTVSSDSPLEGDGFEPSVPRVGNYAHETALFDRHGIFRPFSTAAAPDLE